MADASCPWKGLAPYGDRDGDTFFGRDADIAACLARLGESPVLVVTGPSGSGKSSLVQAGLVPALRASGAEVEVFTPGADGALAMAAARSRRTGDPLLLIDQFEEVFTPFLGSGRDARKWLRNLAAYAHRPRAGRRHDPRRLPQRISPSTTTSRSWPSAACTSSAPLAGARLARGDRRPRQLWPVCGSRTSSSTCSYATPRTNRERFRSLSARARREKPGSAGRGGCSPSTATQATAASEARSQPVGQTSSTRA